MKSSQHHSVTHLLSINITHSVLHNYFNCLTMQPLTISSGKAQLKIDRTFIAKASPSFKDKKHLFQSIVIHCKSQVRFIDRHYFYNGYDAAVLHRDGLKSIRELSGLFGHTVSSLSFWLSYATIIVSIYSSELANLRLIKYSDSITSSLIIYILSYQTLHSFSRMSFPWKGFLFHVHLF